jgi:hypothetical protein
MLLGSDKAHEHFKVQNLKWSLGYMYPVVIPRALFAFINRPAKNFTTEIFGDQNCKEPAGSNECIFLLQFSQDIKYTRSAALACMAASCWRHGCAMRYRPSTQDTTNNDT